MKTHIWLLWVFLAPLIAFSQTDQKFTRADTLRGALRPERTCYDVTYEHLDVKIDPAEGTVEGSNTGAEKWPQRDEKGKQQPALSDRTRFHDQEFIDGHGAATKSRTCAEVP